MENEIEIKNRILNTASEQFLKHGFTKVTVDEIASKIGMSKKTIYKYYPSKDDLIRAVTNATLSEIDSGYRSIVEDSDLEFVEKLRKLMTYLGLHLSKLSRPIIEDLERNAPHIWENISAYRTKMIHENFGTLIRQGRDRGIFRDDIDEHLVMLIYANVIEHIINPETLSQLPLTATQVYESIIKVIFEGILTDKANLV
ncbi:MAG: TetR/AcrR family transcriptional regulator [Bacteroidota bacterium]|nr:TetR/AcrR family transcriptional regulator [Bacteroidota bacterium]